MCTASISKHYEHLKCGRIESCQLFHIDCNWLKKGRSHYYNEVTQSTYSVSLSGETTLSLWNDASTLSSIKIKLVKHFSIFITLTIYGWYLKSIIIDLILKLIRERKNEKRNGWYYLYHDKAFIGPLLCTPWVFHSIRVKVIILI